MTYDINFFISKFQAIPEDKWIENQLFNEKKTKFCANGHCGVTSKCNTDPLGEMSGNFIHTDESMYLGTLFLQRLHISTELINDGAYYGAESKSPKQRILAALRDIKRMEEENNKPEYPDITKQIARLPIQQEVSDKVAEKSFS